MDASAHALVNAGEYLSLYTAFGANRDSCPDHYDKRKGIYIADCSNEAKLRLEQGESTESFFLTEWTYELAPGEKERRGLATIAGKSYLVYEECLDISQSNHFLGFLGGNDFALAVEATLGGVMTLVEAPCHGENITHDPELLLLQLKQNGTHTVELDFGDNCHSFVLLKEGGMVTLVHYHDQVRSMTMTQDCFDGLWRAFASNADLAYCLFGTELYCGKRTPDTVSSINFSPSYPTRDAIVTQLQRMDEAYFADRAEHAHITQLIAKINSF